MTAPQPKKHELNRALADAVREIGRLDTPQDMEQRGVRRVRRISMQDISRMIEKAVNRTIMERTLGVDAAEMQLLFDRAQVGLVGIMKGVEEVEATRGAVAESQRELLAEIDEMRRDQKVANADHPLELDDPIAVQMRDAIRDCFLRTGVNTPEGRAAERDLFARAFALLEALRRRAAEAAAASRDVEIDRLDRRIHKLVDSLETTEAALKRVAAMKNVDLGIASLYRVVQGLATDESNVELKKEMMSLIFKANLDLQKKPAVTT